MARLPLPRRRRSRSQQAIDTLRTLAQVWTTVKVGSAAARAAKGGAKVYGTAKTAKVAGRPVVAILAIPAAVAGGVLVWRKVSSSSPSTDDWTPPSAADTRPLGPVATPESVSPPPDPPAGASNPPVAPDPENADRTGPPVGPSPTFADEAT